MIPRHLENVLRDSAREYPVVTVTGPRQSGKTTLVRVAFSNHEYVSLEDYDNRTFALGDARGFLGQFSGNVIIDEAQRAPELFSYIQGIVDSEDKPGRFVLTGSQNFLLLHKITQSLAGRTAILHLLPFSRSELAGRKLCDLSNICRPGSRRVAIEGDLFQMLFKGFYPRIHDKHLSAPKWLRNYYSTYLERDVRDIANLGEMETFSRFVGLCAGRCGQLLNLSALANDCGISHSTARRWISILQASFVVTLLRPHHKNFNKRLIKSPKLYFLDTGLLCRLLRIRSPKDLRIHGSRGAVFESWVISEIIKNYYNRGLEADIYFWRESSGHEIDLVIEENNHLIAVEVKSGETISSDFFKDLRYWRELANDSASPAALVYGGNTSYTRENIAVKSWAHWC